MELNHCLIGSQLQGGAGSLVQGLVETDIDVVELGKQWNAVNTTMYVSDHQPLPVVFRIEI